jgi:hypothetical protein
MGSKDAARYHELRSIHLRELAEHATTPRMQEWLLEQAEEEERMAAGESPIGTPPPLTNQSGIYQPQFHLSSLAIRGRKDCHL